MSSPSSRAEPAIATVATRSHFAAVRVLAQSLAEHHPELRLFALLADEPGDGVPAAEEPCTVVPLDELGVPRPPHYAFRAALMPHTVAGKPWLIRHLLGAGWRSVLYVDADMLVVGDLGPLLERVRSHALVLTPHLTAPATVGRELDILRAGTYNAGVVGVSDRPETQRFLAWWQARIEAHGPAEPDRGLHHDQRWLDLAHGFVADLHVERDPAYNAGHWELPERLAREPAPRLLHFSGFDPERPGEFSRHAPRIAGLEAVSADYAERLLAAGHAHARSLPRRFDSYDDGSPIPPEARAAHAELGATADRFGDPFRSGPGSFRDWFEQRRS